jgi:hypothetical protein
MRECQFIIVSTGRFTVYILSSYPAYFVFLGLWEPFNNHSTMLQDCDSSLISFESMIVSFLTSHVFGKGLVPASILLRHHSTATLR